MVISNPTAETLINFLRDVRNNPDRAKLDIDALPEDFRNLGEELSSSAQVLGDLRNQLRERHEDIAGEMGIIKQRTQDLARSNSLFETITSLMPEWIVMIDRETGEHLFANHPVKNDLASPLFEQQLYEILLEFAREIEDDAEISEEEFPLLSDEAIQWIHLFLYPVRWYEHNAVAAVLSDVTAEKEQRAALENVAYKDMLTGAYNRHYGMKLLNDWISKNKKFIIAFIDMDRLKYVNDVFGHAEGDAYILKVTEVLNKFSPNATVCRLGGDEFMLLCQDITLEDGEARMEKLRDELVALEYVTDGGRVTYKRSLSYGIVEASEDNLISPSDLLSTADEKMYEYKKAHKAERRDAPD
ncbi:MAG: GGDEF domain-containing protein [Clostridiales Family XIII bacterium]|jgi:diguanylate cyclase (GGDEF)-like protein|nr:GGDEF domain-containing protein [Clostridiales Family XIII bacterium]